MRGKIKVTVTGANGKNGRAVLHYLKGVKGIGEVCGLVRKKEQIKELVAHLHARDEGNIDQDYAKPNITDDPKDCSESDFWISFKGVNLQSFLRENKSLVVELKRKGMHYRDMLLLPNLPIIAGDARMALEYSPDCIYVPQGNPTDLAARIAVKLGFNPFNVFYTGTMMEQFRLTSILSAIYGDMRFMSSPGEICYIGEHGEEAVLLKSRLFFSQCSPEEIIHSMGIPRSKYLRKLERIYKKVVTEDKWIRQWTGETPHEGPGRVTAELIALFMGVRDNPASFGLYVEKNRYYGVEDTALSLPVLVSCEGVSKILEIALSVDERAKLDSAIKHLKAMNAIADEMMVKAGLI